jgi:polysaccharide chain length determinant protein (PEP-CTERM system associated)
LTTPPNESSANNVLADLKLSDYLNIALRRKWWIVLSALGMLIASTIVAHRLKNVYRAETTILVDSSQVPNNYVAPVVSTDISARLTTLQQQVLSPTRLKRLVEAEHLYPDPTGKRTEDDIIQSVQRSIVVQVVNPGGGKMGAFLIGYNSSNRDDVARVTNRIAQMFIEENLRAREEQTSGTAQFLEDQMDETKRELDDTEAQLRAIKSQNVFDLPESKPYHMEALATLRGQVQGLQDKINQDQRDKAMLQSMLYSGGPAPTIDVDSDAGAGSGNVSPDQAEVQRLGAKLAQLRTRYGPAHPEVRRTQTEIDNLKKKIASAPPESPETIAQQKPAIETTKAGTRNPVLQAQIEKLDEEIKDLSTQILPLQKQIDAHTARLAEMPVFEQKISRLQQDNESLRKQYASLQDKKQAADMSYALEIRQKAERFVVLDAAQTPLKPAAPNRPLISLAGLFGGLMMGAALAGITEMNDETVRSEAEASRILGKPVLSGVPCLVSSREQKTLWMRGVAMLAGTVVASTAFGFLLSFVAGRF